MIPFGQAALLLAVLAAAWGMVGGALAGISGSRGLALSSRRAVLAIGVLLTLVLLAVEYALLTDQFGVALVAQTSHLAQPTQYKISALWAGQSGSLLLWAWILSIYAVAASYVNRRRHPELMPWVQSVLSGILLFFTGVLAFVTPPLALGAPHTDGAGMNPLLQNYWMMIHPPTLYLGYVGFAVPFAFAMAALLARRTGEVWIRTTRRWTIFAWLFLGTGIVLGSYWAYIELGWGGYWAWDPVENASFMPWLVGTAFLHSVMIQEQKRMLKVWNMILIILTFSLCIFGTFLTRSGVITSVHAFTGSGLGPPFGAFLALVVIGAFGLVIWRLPDLRSEHRLDSLVSRESSFLLNNILFVGIAFAVFVLTTWPIWSELATGKNVSMGQPIFNRVTLPWFLVLILLSGIGPLIAWRRASLASLRRNFLAPALVALGVDAALFAAGVREAYPLLFYFCSVFVIGTIAGEFWRGARGRQKTNGESFPTALGRLIWRNKRRYGGYVVHAGVVLAVVGITGSSAYKKEFTFEQVSPGSKMDFDGYSLSYDRHLLETLPEHTRLVMETTLSRDGKPVTGLVTERRFYARVDNPTTEVAIHSNWAVRSVADLARFGEDVYLVPITVDPDTGLASFKVFVNPFVNWLWAGGIVLILGSFLAVLPDRREQQALAMAVEQERAVA
jgi:cytochrome c-type biogenesis protein CcmF